MSGLSFHQLHVVVVPMAFRIVGSARRQRDGSDRKDAARQIDEGAADLATRRNNSGPGLEHEIAFERATGFCFCRWCSLLPSSSQIHVAMAVPD